MIVCSTGPERAARCVQASSDMAALYKLLPVTARLVVAGSEDAKEVPAEAVVVGDVIMVLPGDRVPVDGVVEAGRTTVNEAAVTGEPMPVTKIPGSTVTAGTSNVDGAPLCRYSATCGSCSTRKRGALHSLLCLPALTHVWLQGSSRFAVKRQVAIPPSQAS